MEHYFSKKWIYFSSKLFHFSLTNPFETIKKLKGVFKPLKCTFWSGKRNYVPLFYYGVRKHPLLFEAITRDVLWKDKYGTPRFEECPCIVITLFKYSFVWRWLTETSDQDDYWEQALWYLYYCNANIEKAKKTWPWLNYETKESSWNNTYLADETEKQN